MPGLTWASTSTLKSGGDGGDGAQKEKKKIGTTSNPTEKELVLHSISQKKIGTEVQSNPTDPTRRRTRWITSSGPAQSPASWGSRHITGTTARIAGGRGTKSASRCGSEGRGKRESACVRMNERMNE